MIFLHHQPVVDSTLYITVIIAMAATIAALSAALWRKLRSEVAND